MFKRMAILSMAALLSACTIEQQGAETVSQFHMPFTYGEWEPRVVTNERGQEACVVTSGHNGLAFVLRKNGSNRRVSVQTNRFMPKGTWMTVTVNDKRFETSNPYFSAQDALAMAEEFSVAEVAYAEWSEVASVGGRTRFGTVLKLKGFQSAFDRCKG